MAALIELQKIHGKWQGINYLWLSPDGPADKSDSFAEMEIVAQNQFNEFRYSWAFDGKPAEGRLLIGLTSEPNQVQAVWFDTWHMKNQFMICEGVVTNQDMVTLQGSYAAPPGPDWGWQITFELMDQDEFVFLMHNITPRGEKILAVKASYYRQV